MQLKQKYSIKKSLLRLLPFVMLMAPACKKNRVEPTLPEPEHYNVVIDWNWKDNLGLAPPMDTICKYANNKYIDTIFINLTSPNSTGMGTTHFRKARDSLQTRIDVAPTRVRGMGTIYPWRADLPDLTPIETGMCIADSLWFTSHGWAVQRYHHSK
jgi:hypothetical protein